MLDIKKEPRSPEIETMRALIRDRGSYLYHLVTAAKEAGVDWEKIARAGLTQNGCYLFRSKFQGVEGLDQFIKAYLSDTTKQIFDSDLIERDDEHLVIKAGYCPLMHAWVLCGGDDEYVAKLCDIAMDSDRAMVNSIPGVKFSLRKSLAFGDHQCEFLVEADKESETK